MLSTKVKVECPKCRRDFKASAKDIRVGLTLTCDFCKTPLRITENPEHKGTQGA